MNRRSGSETKKLILDTALKMFSLHGYTNTSVRDIAKEACVSVGTIYIYFKNKDDLYLEIIRDKRRELYYKVKDSLKNSKNSKDALSRFIEIYVYHIIKNKEFILLHIRERSLLYDKKEKLKFFKKQKKILKEIVDNGIKNKEFKKFDSDEISDIILSIMRGILLTIIFDGKKEIKVNTIKELVFNGILNK